VGVFFSRFYVGKRRTRDEDNEAEEAKEAEAAEKTEE
jgi:sec-independent protein translocase protein TatC